MQICNLVDVRCFDDDADPGGLQRLGDRHGDLFGQPLLDCGQKRTNTEEPEDNELWTLWNKHQFA